MTLKVSDHAMVRFLERAGGLDVDSVKVLIAASLARAHQAAMAIGQVDYTVKVDGMIFYVRNGVLVTVCQSGERL